MKIGEKIKLLRITHDMTQQDLVKLNRSESSKMGKC